MGLVRLSAGLIVRVEELEFLSGGGVGSLLEGLEFGGGGITEEGEDKLVVGNFLGELFAGDSGGRGSSLLEDP